MMMPICTWPKCAICFFGVAWRNKDYIYTWYKRLVSEPFLFPDQAEFAAMVQEGDAHMAHDDREKTERSRDPHAGHPCGACASDTAGELATIVKI